LFINNLFLFFYQTNIYSLFYFLVLIC